MLTACSPTKARYVHFKTPDADKLRAFGPFWHALFFGGAVVPQDEIDTYTVVEILPPDADLEPITDPEGFVAKILGGLTGKPFPVRIGTMLGTGSWKLYYGIADTFRSQKGRVFLAGDSGAYNQSAIPTAPLFDGARHVCTFAIESRD